MEFKKIEDIMKQPCHVHFVGIGGISMSGLAEILIDNKYPDKPHENAGLHPHWNSGQP